MAGNNIKGITVMINGDTSPLDKALKGVNKTSSDLTTELKQVNYQLKFEPNSTVLLTQKQQLLTESITNTKVKLDALKEAQKQVQLQFEQGKVSEEQYRALQREVIKTADQLKLLEKQAKNSNVALSKIAETSDKIAKGSTKVGQAMMPATIAVAALGGAAVKMGSDYIESLNKVDVAFGSSAKSVENFSKTTLDSFGIASGTALDMASNFGDMATSMGLPQAAAALMSEKLVGLGGDLASFKNISIDEANTALDSVFTGETESLKKLGIVMTQQNLQEFAASKGIKTKIADMTQQEQVQLRYNYVMAKTTSAQGDFARTSDGAANSTRVATESIKEAGESIGVMLAPILAKAAQYVAGLAKNFSGLSDGTKKTILIVLAIVAAIAPLAFIISGIATAIGALTVAFTFLMGPIGLVILAIGALIAIGVLLYKNWDVVSTFLGKIFKSIADTTVNVFNGIVDFFKNTWNSITTTVTNIWNGIGTFFTNLWAGIKTTTENAWNGIKDFFSNTWNSISIAATNVFNGIENFFSNTWNGIKNVVSSVWIGIKTIFTNTINGIVTFVTTTFSNQIEDVKIIFASLQIIFENVWDVIKNIFLGAILLIIDLVTGNFTRLKDDASHIFSNLSNLFSNIWDNIKNIFKYAVQIITTTLSQAWSLIVNVAIDAFNGFNNFMSSLWQAILTTASNTWTAVKTTVYNLIVGTINSAVAAWNGFTSFISGLWNAITNTAVAAWNGFKAIIHNLITGIVNGAINIFNGVVTFFANLPGNLYNLGVNMFNGLKNGIGSILNGLGGFISSGFNAATSFITSLPGKAYSWGIDFIQGLINGINDKIRGVVDTVTNVADKIRRLLHFSTPDEGPLKDYESWMPDFMGGLAKGIENSKSLVTNAVKGLAANVNLGMQLTPAMAGMGSIGSSSQNTSKQGDTNINFNGSYSFADKKDIDYFMNKAGQLVQRRQG